MRETIKLSNGDEYLAELEVWYDLACERPGRYALFWAKPGSTTGTRACDESFRNIREAVEFGEIRFGETARYRR